MFVLYIAWALVCGFLQRLSISAVISRFVLLAIGHLHEVFAILHRGEHEVSLGEFGRNTGQIKKREGFVLRF
jgi:hypothetical protein